MNLRRLMYSGYYGGSRLQGVDPSVVRAALERRFDVVVAHQGGVLDFEARCYSPADGALRLKVQYGWLGGGWVYQPLAARRA